MLVPFMKLSTKVTVPVGVPMDCATTLAVNVSESPKFDGLAPEVKATAEELGAVMTCGRAGEAFKAKLSFPLYTTLMLWVPMAREETVRLAEAS